MLTDIQIAQNAEMLPIEQVAERVGIPGDALLKYGNYKAKITREYIDSLQKKPDGKLVLVTAINPTAAGEGKTTVTYELGDETYIGYTETKEYVSYADMEKALLEMTYQTDMLDEMNDEEDAEPDDSEYTLYTPVEEKEDNHIFSAVEIEKNGGIFYSSYTFHATLNPQTGDYNGTAFKDIFKVTISLEMPEKISQSQGGAVDGNKITFDVTDVSEGGELAAFCDANNTGLIVGIIAVFVVLAVIGAIVAKKHQQ